MRARRALAATAILTLTAAPAATARPRHDLKHRAVQTCTAVATSPDAPGSDSSLDIHRVELRVTRTTVVAVLTVDTTTGDASLQGPLGYRWTLYISIGGSRPMVRRVADLLGRDADGVATTSTTIRFAAPRSQFPTVRDITSCAVSATTSNVLGTVDHTI